MNFFVSVPQFLKNRLRAQLTPGAVIKLNEKMDDGKVQEKRFVVLNVDATTTTCVVINSQINQFIQKRAHLLKCQALMPQATHPFMDHDSHVDCVRTRPYGTDNVLDELVNNPKWMLGRITLQMRDDIQAALLQSPAIPPAEKQALGAVLATIK